MSQPPLSEDSKFVLRGLIIMTALATLVGVALALVMGVGLPGSGRGGSREGGTDGWQSYRNAEFGYQVSYPPDWQIVVGDRLTDPSPPFETQGVRLTKGPESEGGPRVLVTVNFQGGWCETGKRQDVRDVTVSGITGRHQECYADTCPGGALPECQSEPYNIVRYFQGAKGHQNYTVIGSPTGDAATVRRIVESFRFLD